MGWLRRSLRCTLRTSDFRYSSRLMYYQQIMNFPQHWPQARILHSAYPFIWSKNRLKILLRLFLCNTRVHFTSPVGIGQHTYKNSRTGVKISVNKTILSPSMPRVLTRVLVSWFSVISESEYIWKTWTPHFIFIIIIMHTSLYELLQFSEHH